MLDEIDKMSMDFRGDPSSALLEVLDPEQNHAFNDHYLEVDLDLSEVMFIATSNSLNIPGPLLDRMEVIRIPGYTEDEKLNIAERYLLPKQLKANGTEARRAAGRRKRGARHRALLHARVRRAQPRARDLQDLPQGGQGNHPRPVPAKAKAKVVKATAKKARAKVLETGRVHVDSDNLDKYLGVRRFDFGRAEQPERGRPGHRPGLDRGRRRSAQIEATVVPGKGRLIHTGQLGDVMKESIQAALTVVRARADALGIDPDFHQKFDVHVHVPEGATPKDGPSAGIAMCTALVSTLTKVPVRSDVAMTGEITLRGRVLPIGGLKEKLLAAHRGGITTVIIPDENQKDLVDIPNNITGQLDIHPVHWIDEVLDLALERPLSPNKVKDGEAEKVEVAREEGKGDGNGTPSLTH